MKILRGTFRIITFLLMLILTTGLVLATAWLPLRVRGVRLSAWLLVPICRLLLPLFNVEFTAREAAAHHPARWLHLSQPPLLFGRHFAGFYLPGALFKQGRAGQLALHWLDCPRGGYGVCQPGR
jgi:hypothetical protein